MGHLPQEWKTSIVVPVPKGKDKHLLSNYRPISLIPIISKVMDKHIASILRDAISLKCPISQNQWGVCPHKSTTTSLASTVHGWTSSLHDGNDVCTVFFDLKKTFDSVPHQRLLAKLAALELPQALFQWLKDYLTNHCQHVKVARATSSQRPVLSGVPQGSILGPILFVYYVDDINTVKLSKGASLTMYADDICYSQSVLDQSTFQDIQHDIDKITQWAENSKPTFNESKTVWMLLSKKSHYQFTNAELHLNGKRLDRVNEVHYLGVTISSDLAWSAHVQFVISNAKRKLGYIFHAFCKQCSTEVLLNWYKHLIHPTVEYCCSVF